MTESGGVCGDGGPDLAVPLRAARHEPHRVEGDMQSPAEGARAVDDIHFARFLAGAARWRARLPAGERRPQNKIRNRIPIPVAFREPVADAAKPFRTRDNELERLGVSAKVERLSEVLRAEEYVSPALVRAFVATANVRDAPRPNDHIV